MIILKVSPFFNLIISFQVVLGVQNIQLVRPNEFWNGLKSFLIKLKQDVLIKQCCSEIKTQLPPTSIERTVMMACVYMLSRATLTTSFSSFTGATNLVDLIWGHSNHIDRIFYWIPQQHYILCSEGKVNTSETMGD